MDPYTVATVGMLAGSAVYKLADKIIENSKAKKYDSVIIGLRKGAIDPKTGLQLKTKRGSFDDDLEAVNPGIETGLKLKKNNCMMCTTAYELRRRGYDVMAGNSSTGLGKDVINKWFPDAKFNEVSHDSNKDEYGFIQKHFSSDQARHSLDATMAMSIDNGKTTKPSEQQLKAKARQEAYINKVINQMEKEPNGSRGNIMVNWPDGGGHSMIYEIKNGKLNIMDAQIGKKIDDPTSLLKYCPNITYIRYDNVDFDPKGIKGYIQ
jgi:hypothetical protein